MSDAALLLPEAVLAGGILAALLAEALGGRGRWPAFLVIAGVLAALAATVHGLDGSGAGTGAMVVEDGLTVIARLLTLVATLVVLAAGHRQPRRDHAAWAAVVGSLALGGLVAAAATHLVAILVALELIGLSAYALAGWRRDHGGAEAGMKYVLFGGVATALTAYGMSHVFGLTGHLDLAGIGAVVAQGGGSPALAAAMALAGAGMAVKLALPPAHLIAPDVYQGAEPLSVAALATLPKVAAAAILLRGLDACAPGAVAAAVAPTVAGVGMLALAVGAVTALSARHAGRLVAFSGIGHAGAVVLAAAAGDRAAATAYLLAYLPALLLAVLALDALGRRLGGLGLADLDGAARRHPWLVAALGLGLASLLGLPPLPGFFAKWWVLIAVLDHPGWGAVAAAVLVLTTVVSAWAYLLILRACLLRDPGGRPQDPAADPDHRVLLVGLAVVLAALALWPDSVAWLRTLLG